MPKTAKQRRAACARAHGKGRAMKSMSKKTAKKWCGSKLHKGKKR